MGPLELAERFTEAMERAEAEIIAYELVSRDNRLR